MCDHKVIESGHVLVCSKVYVRVAPNPGDVTMSILVKYCEVLGVTFVACMFKLTEG